MKKIALLTAGLSGSLLLAACGGSGAETNVADNAAIEEIGLNDTAPTDDPFATDTNLAAPIGNDLTATDPLTNDSALNTADPLVNAQ